MTDKIVSGGGVGSALSGAISDKLKAKATGIKEKFDPMNIARAMTGGSRLAPAILGRLTGRSQSDINYFAGGKNQKSSYTQVPTQMTTPGEGLGGSAVEVLNRMLSFMQNSREEDLKRKDTAKQFVEEQKVEEQRRHNEFLKVLKEYTSLGTTTLVGKKEDEGGGLFDFIKKMVDGMIDKFLSPFKWLMDNKTMLLNIFRLFGGPLAGMIVGGAAIVWLAEQLKVYFRENVADMKIIGPTEAANLLLSGNQKNIDKFPGGEKALRDIIENSPKRATEILARGDKAEILAAGGEKKLREIEKDIVAQPAKRNALQDMSESVTPRAVFIEKGRGTKATNAAKWDREFGPYYDPETGKRLDLLNVPGAEPVATQSDVRKIDNAAMATPVTPTQSDVRKIDNDVMSTPVPEVPISSRMNSAIDENQDLNLSNNTDTQSFISPVVSSTTSSVDLPDRPIPATALVRDKTPILDYVLQSSMSPV